MTNLVEQFKKLKDRTNLRQLVWKMLLTKKKKYERFQLDLTKPPELSFADQISKDFQKCIYFRSSESHSPKLYEGVLKYFYKAKSLKYNKHFFNLLLPFVCAGFPASEVFDLYYFTHAHTLGNVLLKDSKFRHSAVFLFKHLLLYFSPQLHTKFSQNRMEKSLTLFIRKCIFGLFVPLSSSDPIKLLPVWDWIFLEQSPSAIWFFLLSFLIEKESILLNTDSEKKLKYALDNLSLFTKKKNKNNNKNNQKNKNNNKNKKNIKKNTQNESTNVIKKEQKQKQKETNNKEEKVKETNKGKNMEKEKNEIKEKETQTETGTETGTETEQKNKTETKTETKPKPEIETETETKTEIETKTGTEANTEEELINKLIARSEKLLKQCPKSFSAFLNSTVLSENLNVNDFRTLRNFNVLPLSADELFINKHISKKFVVLDCRATYQKLRGVVPHSIHLDPQDMFEDGLDQFWKSFLELKTKKIRKKHLCIIGNGTIEKDKELSLVVLQLISHGIKYISRLQGGFKQCYFLHKNHQIQLAKPNNAIIEKAKINTSLTSDQNNKSEQSSSSSNQLFKNLIKSKFNLSAISNLGNSFNFINSNEEKSSNKGEEKEGSQSNEGKVQREKNQERRGNQGEKKIENRKGEMEVKSDGEIEMRKIIKLESTQSLPILNHQSSSNNFFVIDSETESESESETESESGPESDKNSLPKLETSSKQSSENEIKSNSTSSINKGDDQSISSSQDGSNPYQSVKNESTDSNFSISSPSVKKEKINNTNTNTNTNTNNNNNSIQRTKVKLDFMKKNSLLNVKRWFQDKSIHFFSTQRMKKNFLQVRYIVITDEYIIELEAHKTRLNFGILKNQNHLLSLVKIIIPKNSDHGFVLAYNKQNKNGEKIIKKYAYNTKRRKKISLIIKEKVKRVRKKIKK
ncbi:hypothetical protein M0812_06892 [Anaeramoeba flamelloides]|uniref:Rhodanese domain-containing protein n=1 Tax=Anaeramoeba flamelloides TaxID=1746091 RepID=A0AAV8A8U8_9EUKA|nr:hypothetical protein M0812_06892 [Anaeramoeba flamelloides]